MRPITSTIRMDEEEQPELPETMPGNIMDKMMSNWMFDKKFIEQRKVFL